MILTDLEPVNECATFGDTFDQLIRVSTFSKNSLSLEENFDGLKTFKSKLRIQLKLFL